MVQLHNPSDQSIMLNFDENWEIWLEKFPNIKGISTKEWGLSENFLSVKSFLVVKLKFKFSFKDFLKNCSEITFFKCLSRRSLIQEVMVLLHQSGDWKEYKMKRKLKV